MLKPLYLAKGVLISPLYKGKFSVAVDDILYAYVHNQIQYGDWGYLRLSTKDHVEIVKVLSTSAPNSLLVQRAQDHTKEHTFFSASVDYVLTADEVKDLITPIPLVINTSGVLFDGQKLSLDVTIKGLGTAAILAKAPNIIIGYDIEAYGCCDDNSVAPPIPDSDMPYRITSSGDFRVTDDGDYRTTL